jgi:hypothetical protein
VTAGRSAGALGKKRVEVQKKRYYQHVRFLPEHISEIADAFCNRVGKDEDKLKNLMTVSFENENWEHDQVPEFYSDIRKAGATYSFRLLNSSYDLGL